MISCRAQGLSLVRGPLPGLIRRLRCNAVIRQSIGCFSEGLGGFHPFFSTHLSDFDFEPQVI
jgi:hypothetical protein